MVHVEWPFFSVVARRRRLLPSTSCCLWIAKRSQSKRSEPYRLPRDLHREHRLVLLRSSRGSSVPWFLALASQTQRALLRRASNPAASRKPWLRWCPPPPREEIGTLSRDTTENFIGVAFLTASRGGVVDCVVVTDSEADLRAPWPAEGLRCDSLDARVIAIEPGT